MDEKPSRLRFGLLALFAVIAALAVLASVWNPLAKPSKSDFGQIRMGMTEAEVVKLVGKPDDPVTRSANPSVLHMYQLAPGENWVIVYTDGLVVFSKRMLP